jgi:hypothetical protein
MTTFMTDRSLVNQVRRCGSAAAPTPRSRLDANPIFRVSLEVEKSVFLNSKKRLQTKNKDMGNLRGEDFALACFQECYEYKSSLKCSIFVHK